MNIIFWITLYFSSNNFDLHYILDIWIAQNLYINKYKPASLVFSPLSLLVPESAVKSSDERIILFY